MKRIKVYPIERKILAVLFFKRNRYTGRLERVWDVLFIGALIMTSTLWATAQNNQIKSSSADTTVRILFESSNLSGQGCYRIPSLLTAANGDIIAVVDERIQDCTDLGSNSDINIVVRRSQDGGNTWSPIERVVDYPTGQSASDPSMILEKTTGTIFLFFNYMNLDTEKGIYSHQLVKSMDNGKTWNPPIDITDQISQPGWDGHFKFITSGRGHQTRSGKLVHTLVNLTKGLHLFVSDDYGTTWYLIDTPIIPGNESKIIELENGTWMVNSRSNILGHRLVHRSLNEGMSWHSQPDTTLLDPGCNASLISHTSVINGSQINSLLFSNANDGNQRRNLTIRMSQDLGKSWNVGKTIYQGNAAYSSMTTIDNDEIGLLYERDSYSQIVFTRLALKWITNSE